MMRIRVVASELASYVRHASKLARYIKWLGSQDSNLDRQIQSLQCYRYTTPQAEIIPSIKHVNSQGIWNRNSLTQCGRIYTFCCKDYQKEENLAGEVNHKFNTFDLLNLNAV